MERLNAPEPAASLWRRIAPVLDDATLEFLRPGERWTLTGGTVLAARWGHRRSVDIDLRLDPGGPDRLAAAKAVRFHKAMEAAGATGGRQWHRQITVDFGRSELDLWHPEDHQVRHPAGTERDAEVDGRVVRVESTAQIILGKTRRADRRSPVRDVYDVAAAIAADPGALEAAVNCRAPEHVRRLEAKWRRERLLYRQMAAREIQDVPADYSEIASNPAEHAAGALKAVSWTDARIVVSPDGPSLQTKRTDGTERILRGPGPDAGPDAAVEWLEASGAAEALRSRADSRRAAAAIVEEVAAAARGGAPVRTSTVWEWAGIATRTPGRAAPGPPAAPGNAPKTSTGGTARRA